MGFLDVGENKILENIDDMTNSYRDKMVSHGVSPPLATLWAASYRDGLLKSVRSKKWRRKVKGAFTK